MVGTSGAPVSGELPGKGLVCPDCGANDTFVVETKPRFGRIYRRRECRACGRRWTTCEIDRALLADKNGAEKQKDPH